MQNYERSTQDKNSNPFLRYQIIGFKIIFEHYRLQSEVIVIRENVTEKANLQSKNAEGMH